MNKIVLKNKDKNNTGDDKWLEIIHSAIIKSLDSFGFISGERKCYATKYGDAYYIENWSSKDVANFISDDVKKAIITHISQNYIPKVDSNDLDKGLEVWLYQQYAEIDKQLEYLDAKEDKIKETADEVGGEL